MRALLALLHGQLQAARALKEEVVLATFPLQLTDNLRHADTDRQGHINNAVFATMLETGRVHLIHLMPEGKLADEGATWVIARLVIDFRAEMHWPGTVTIATKVTNIGRSSVTLAQALFQGDTCTASGESVLVQMDEKTRKARPMTPAAIARLEKLRGV